MSQTSLKQKKKNEAGMRYSKESLETEKRRDSDKSGVRLNSQGSQELPTQNTDSRGNVVQNQWSRTSRSPSTRAPSADEPRSRNTSVKVELPNSSTTSRTSSTSPSQHEASPPRPQPNTPPRTSTTRDMRQPTAPETQASSRRTSKNYDNADTWSQGMGREARESRDSQSWDYGRDPRDTRSLSQSREYTRTSPSEWKPYSQRRVLYPPSLQMDSDCRSEMQPLQQQQQQEEEDDDEEAYWSSPKPKNAITIAISSRALFNMADDQKIYEEEGLEKYMEYQLTNENVILTPGPAFRFVKALQHVNSRLRDLYPDEQDLFDIVLMTNNHAQVGVRLINSVNHYGLLIDRFCLTGGKSPIGYLKAYLTNLYLSADSDKVHEAIQEGIASATMYDGAKDMAYCDTQLRVAFDGDAALFSDECEHTVKEHGMDKLYQHETMFENKASAQGPLKAFLEDLGRLQKKFYAKDERLLCPIRTYLVTARSAASSGARVLKTLRRWGLEIDEALFLAGAPKGPILVKIRPHIFFDDQMFNTEGGQKCGTIVAHVPYGVHQKCSN
ncbi:cytosolic 5'-nucleotidase 1B isoform X8 [Ochotona curzoniae]|uniref:cytosolic 5'-nucleotidase 1B isoform X8 n=1 Tax=Ochotona curzoniae TaxID=130825 RepID=UPI001B3474F1|nr:cytosolic 5'-nucleotidase 1B isoform X8 [Ochotona curzoniae]